MSEMRRGEDLLPYVRAAAHALELPLDEARALRVAGYMALAESFARLLDAYPLAVTDEPAAIYTPAPFPTASGGRRAE